jgi:AraC-like DNA-binding protein
MGYKVDRINLGEVVTEIPVSNDHLENISKVLIGYGFQMIDDVKGKIIEKIKTLIIEMIHYPKETVKVNYSTFIETNLNRDYNYLSNLFSEVTGVTIEKYIINQKIERVKELLVYNELTLNEIAFQLGYSSAAHLSSQFKKTTGLTPGYFKQIKENQRKSLDEV